MFSDIASVCYRSGIGDPAKAARVLVLFVFFQVCDHASSLHSAVTNSLITLWVYSLGRAASQVSRRLYASPRLSWRCGLYKVCAALSYAACIFLLSAMIQAKSFMVPSTHHAVPSDRKSTRLNSSHANISYA